MFTQPLQSKATNASLVMYFKKQTFFQEIINFLYEHKDIFFQRNRCFHIGGELSEDRGRIVWGELSWGQVV